MRNPSHQPEESRARRRRRKSDCQNAQETRQRSSGHRALPMPQHLCGCLLESERRSFPSAIAMVVSATMLRILVVICLNMAMDLLFYGINHYLFIILSSTVGLPE